MEERLIASWMATAPSFGAGTLEREPLKTPTGVLTAERMNASCISFRLWGDDVKCRWMEAILCCGCDAMADLVARRRVGESIMDCKEKEFGHLPDNRRTLRRREETLQHFDVFPN